ncbi:MAG: hypothetical protein ACREDA_06155, partial [Methylocella sp.]
MDEEREKMGGGFDPGQGNEANGATERRRGSRAGVIARLFGGIFSARPDKSAPRIRLAAWVFLGIYGIIAGQLIDVGLRPDPPASFKR